MQETSQPTFSAGKSVDKKQEEATAGRILVDDNCTVSNNAGQAVEGEEIRAAGGSTTLRMYDQIATESPLVDEKVKTKNVLSCIYILSFCINIT